MKNCDAFSGCHPIICFLYFALVLVFSMCFMHPLCLGVSLFSALTYSIYLRGRKALRFSLIFVLPMMLLTALLNPAFSHEGATILRYFPSGNPLTLESIVYGIAASAMLGAVILWFSCYNEVMTSDKFVYLFGRIIPALSLVLSMTLRFVPRFSAQIKIAAEAQRCIGRDISSGGIVKRAKNGLAILSIMITWSMENALETADSMKSRGYGLKGRTAFSVYRFSSRDRQLLIWLLFCAVYIIFGWAAGGLRFRYYPTLKGTEITTFPASFMLTYLALCLTPLILDIQEEFLWHKSQREQSFL